MLPLCFTRRIRRTGWGDEGVQQSFMNSSADALEYVVGASSTHISKGQKDEAHCHRFCRVACSHGLGVRVRSFQHQHWHVCGHRRFRSCGFGCWRGGFGQCGHFRQLRRHVCSRFVRGWRSFGWQWRRRRHERFLGQRHRVLSLYA